MQQDIKIFLRTSNLRLFYNEKEILQSVNISFHKKGVHALIGPSGCGKSSLLRCFNRMNDFYPQVKIVGNIYYHEKNIYDKNVDPVSLRKKIGMVFQKPNPFAFSIEKNILWGPKIHGMVKNPKHIIESNLKKVALWSEVKDRLFESGLNLSGGQQQRLCIARALAMDPEVLLMDEPCASLDPIATSAIEDLLHDLKNRYLIVIVTHSMQQARRISDRVSFMYQGKIIETKDTEELFKNPENELTWKYISGKFG